VAFRLALAWIPAEQPLYILIDDTLARKTGKGISLATMHHDPLLSSARKPFCRFGHVWVVLALWVPLPMGGSRGSRCRCCSGCTSEPGAVGHGMRRADHGAAPGSGRRRPRTRRTRDRRSWCSPASC
jgi:hypothetical protein